MLIIHFHIHVTSICGLTQNWKQFDRFKRESMCLCANVSSQHQNSPLCVKSTTQCGVLMAGLNRSGGASFTCAQYKYAREPVTATAVEVPPSSAPPTRPIRSRSLYHSVTLLLLLLLTPCPSVDHSLLTCGGGAVCTAPPLATCVPLRGARSAPTRPL